MTAPTVAPADTDVPCRADGLDLIGEMGHSGFREPPCLVRRGDGQTLQLTALLYAVLEAIDGQRDHAAIAELVSERIGKRASAENVRFLVEEKLQPLGVLCDADGNQPEVKKANPLLSLRFRFVVSNERVTRRITAPFAALFHPLIVVPVLAAFVALVGWVFFVQGLGAGTRQLLYSPGLLILLFALTAVSAGFHEFGHAAACRYGGATPGAMGAGIYLVWPAFYTDVTDSYRLDRGGRLRTDLGGLYFNCIFSLATFGAWAATGWDALLLLIPLQVFQMIHQLLPFVRMDGYYILADLTGVPDLFARIKPTLTSAVPGHETDQRVAVLKPWVRAVVTLWVIIVIPVLLLSLGIAIVSLPRALATAWDSLGLQWKAMTGAWSDGKPVEVIARLLSIGALILPVASTLYLLGRVVSRAGGGLWNRATNPVARAAVLALGIVLALGAAWLWWPNGEYRPIQPGERGRVQDVAHVVTEVPSGRPGLTVEREQELDGAPFRSTGETPEEAEKTPALEEDEEPTASTTSTTEATRSSTTTTDAPRTTTTTTTEPSTTSTTAPDTETTTP